MEDVQLQFLSGAEMHPSAIRSRWPAARFVSRAKLDSPTAGVTEPFATYLTSELWGILIDTGQPGAGELTVIADDGRTFRVAAAGDSFLGGDPVQVLAAARYWELPPSYVNALMDACGDQGDEPRDDAVMG